MGLMRYYCENLLGNRGQSHQSAEFTFRAVPPVLIFTLWDHDARQTWQLHNTRLNFQSRDSLRTLRNHEAWEIGRGFEARGVFRAILPTQSTITLPITITLNVEISWGPVFLNITGQSGQDWLLWSTRAGSWTHPNHPPPQFLVYLEPYTENPVPESGRITSVRITEVDDDYPNRRGHELRDRSRSSTDVDDEEPSQSRNQAPIPIVSEPVQPRTPTRPLIRPVVLTPPQMRLRPQFAIANQNSAAVSNQSSNPAIMLNGSQETNDPSRNETVNQSNNQSVPERVTINQADAKRPPPMRNQSLRPFRPPPRMLFDESPPLPRSPKPAPPERPPSTFIPGGTGASPEMQRLWTNHQTLARLDTNFHPRLLPVTTINPNQLSAPLSTRTGLVNPPLPTIDDNWNALAPESLRTTDLGIRLEITPASMWLREHPEEERPIVTPPTPTPSNQSSEPPELNPDA